MRTNAVLCAAVVADLVNAGPVAANRALSENRIVEEILKAPYLLPHRSYEVFKQRYGNLQKRQEKASSGGGILESLGKLTSILSKLPAIIATGSSSPGNNNPPVTRVAEMQSEPAVVWPSAKRVKVRYGPYRIPPVSEQNLESEFWKIQGMSNAIKIGAKRPCEGECTLLSVTADLEYADGSPANNSNGAWFHHAVLLNSGPTVVEPTCNQALVESIFLVGNERTDGGYALKGAQVKSGYKLSPMDTFIMQTELMNLDDKEKWVWQTISYEYLPGAQPEYKNGKTVWMTIGEVSNPGLTFCDRMIANPFGVSNLTSEALPRSMKFSEHSKIWKSAFDGYILRTAGHLHEGATGIGIYQNSKMICDSVPTYSKDAVSPMAGADDAKSAKHSHGMRKRQVKAGNYSNSDIEHIASQGSCDYPKGLQLKKGDTMHVQANYDFNVRAGMKNKEGVLDQVMGIVGVLVAF